jgi:hypothetical protein
LVVVDVQMVLSAAVFGSVPWNVVGFSAPPETPGELFAVCAVIGVRLLGRRPVARAWCAATGVHSSLAPEGKRRVNGGREVG